MVVWPSALGSRIRLPARVIGPPGAELHHGLSTEPVPATEANYVTGFLGIGNVFFLQYRGKPHGLPGLTSSTVSWISPMPPETRCGTSALAETSACTAGSNARETLAGLAQVPLAVPLAAPEDVRRCTLIRSVRSAASRRPQLSLAATRHTSAHISRPPGPNSRPCGMLVAPIGTLTGRRANRPSLSSMLMADAGTTT